VLINIKRGVLRTEDSLGFLEKRVDLGVVAQPQVTPASVKPPLQVVSPNKKNVMLRKLLAKKIVVVKREAANLPVADLRKLIELEMSSKNRKSLVPFLSELYSTHTDQVVSKLESLGKNSEKNELTAQTFLDDLHDVIESEKIEVEVPLSD